jgi:hypothetical protein
MSLTKEMKRSLMWSMALLALAAGITATAYAQRSFGGMLVGLALVLAVVSVLLKPLRNLMTITISLVLGLALTEFALGLVQQGALQARLDANYWSRTDIGSIPSPGQHASLKVTPGGEVIYDVKYTIGDDGFRVTPNNSAISAKRINFLGCSATFGEGLNDQETLPAFVKRELGDVQVKNFGVHGYGMHQALAILESPRDTSGQVNFILTAPWHAERSACVPSFALGSPRYELQADGSVVRNGVCGGISYYPLARVLSLSRIYGLVKGAMQSRQSQDAQINLYLALIQRISELSRTRHQALLIGYLKADDHWFTGSFNNEKIVEKFKTMNIEVIDVTLADKSENVPAKYSLHKLDEHPTALANETRAALVANALKRDLTK